MNKTDAIATAIERSKDGSRIYVRDSKGFFFVNGSKTTLTGETWHGTARDGKFHSKASIRAKAARRAYNEAMESCGLVKVRGAVSGKIYWE